MVLQTSEDDVKHYLKDVTKLIAKKLGAGDDDNFENYIKNESPIISNNLVDFITAYKAWYNFHVETDNKPDDQGRTGIYYKLSDDEHDELSNLIIQREESRNILNDSIKELEGCLKQNVEKENEQDNDLKKTFTGK
ncbi:MAG: hypothetical protein Q8N30_00040 [Methylococcales bacterium]|nr:hypothetical protein [Methylococcales bacterium]